MVEHTGFPSFVWSIYPPVSGEQPSGTGIRDLSTRKADSRRCYHHRWQALTLPSHPCLRTGGYFLLRCYALTDIFPFGSTLLFVVRTFLPCQCIRVCTKRAMERSTAFYLLLNGPWLLQIHIHGTKHPGIKTRDIFPVIPFLFAFSAFPVLPHV